MLPEILLPILENRRGISMPVTIRLDGFPTMGPSGIQSGEFKHSDTVKGVNDQYVGK